MRGYLGAEFVAGMMLPRTIPLTPGDVKAACAAIESGSAEAQREALDHVEHASTGRYRIGCSICAALYEKGSVNFTAPPMLCGYTVRAAACDKEWQELVEAARKAGAVELGADDRTDHDIIIDEARGLIVANPSKLAEVMSRLRDVLLEGPEGGAFSW